MPVMKKDSDTNLIFQDLTPLRLVEAVVFDFDGTLAELNVDFGQMRAGLLDIIEQFKLQKNDFKDLFALEMVDAAASAIERLRPEDAPVLREKTLRFICDVEMKGAQRGKLFAGVGEMFHHLRTMKIKTGVVTRNCRDAVYCMYPDIEIDCDVLVTREATERVKPHPEHLFTALEQLSVDPKSAAMVGDHPMDIQTGKAAGVFTVGVLSGYSGAEPLIEARADLIVERVSEIVELIRKQRTR